MFNVFFSGHKMHTIGQTQTQRTLFACLFGWPGQISTFPLQQEVEMSKSGSSFFSLTLIHGFNLSVDSSAYPTTLYKYICPPLKKKVQLLGK